MLSMKSKYALKALADLAGLGAGEVAAAMDIAGRHGISKKFLDAILAELRVAGFVVTRKGRSGGYQLARPADLITVGDVLRRLDGPLAPIGCASRTAYVPCTDCREERSCAVRLTMLEVREAISGVLDGKTLAAFAALSEAGQKGLKLAV